MDAAFQAADVHMAEVQSGARAKSPKRQRNTGEEGEEEERLDKATLTKVLRLLLAVGAAVGAAFLKRFQKYCAPFFCQALGQRAQQSMQHF